MNAVDDVFSKHGVTPSAESLPERRARRRSTGAASVVAATPKPFDWRALKVGDFIQVRGNSGPTSYSEVTVDGVHKVQRIDREDASLPIMVAFEGRWVRPENIVARVEAPKVFDFKTLETGQWIEVKPGDASNPWGKRVQKAGIYRITDTDLGDTSLPIEVAAPDTDGDMTEIWITPEMIVGRATDPALAAEPKPMAEPVRGDFLIHVDIAAILSNREKGEHRPVTVTRRLSDLAVPHIARELAWDGPSRFVHHEFMKIEGTSVQNWIETDAPVTCWRDSDGIVVMTPKPGIVAPPMTRPILGAFVIHVAAPVLMKNRAEGRKDPVIAVRRAHTNWADDVIFARKVEWNGPSRMVHRPTTPVPGTNGRGVSFVETDADLTLYLDGAEPMVLRMPRRAAA